MGSIDMASKVIRYIPFDFREEIDFEEYMDLSRRLFMNTALHMRTLIGGKNPRMLETIQILYRMAKDEGVVRYIPAWEIYKEMKITSIPKFPGLNNKRVFPHMRTFLQMVDLRINADAGVGYNKYYLRITPKGISFIENSLIYLEPKNILLRLRDELSPYPRVDEKNIRMLYFIDLLIKYLPIIDGKNIFGSFPFTENTVSFLGYEVNMPSYDTIKKMRKKLLGWGLLNKVTNIEGYYADGKPINKGYITIINPKISLINLHKTIEQIKGRY